MIKPISEGYKCKRSHAWLKVKPFIEVTLKVIALEEGTGKNEGMLGALVVEGEDDGFLFPECGKKLEREREAATAPHS